jgi:hypothetical protein
MTAYGAPVRVGAGAELAGGKLNRFGRNLLALASGVATGTALALIEPMWGLVQSWLEHRPSEMFTRLTWARIYLEMATLYAVGIALAACAVWWIAGPTLRRHLFSALGLGFVFTAIVAALFYVRPAAEIEGYLTVLVYGLMGAVAGAVTWLVSHPRRKNLFVALD